MPELSLYLGAPLLQAALCLILLPFIIRGHTHSAPNRLLFIWIFGLMVWGIFIFLMRSSPSLEQAHVWEKWLVAIAFPIPFVFYHFAVTFTGGRMPRWVPATVYGATIPHAAGAYFNLVVSGMQMRPYGYAPIPGPMLATDLLSAAGFVVLALVRLYRFTRTAPDAHDRNRANYIFAGGIISLVGEAFDLLPLVGLPLYPGLIFGNIIFCILTTVAILRHRLLDIRIVVRRGVAYLLTSASVAGIYVSITLLVGRVVGADMPLWGTVLLIVAIGFALQPLWQLLQTVVDRWFFGERYDPLRTLEEFSEETHRITDAAQLGERLVELVRRAFKASDTRLLLAGPDEFATAFSAGDPIPGGDGAVLADHSPLISRLRSRHRVIRRRDLGRDPLLWSLTSSETSMFKEIGAELFVPILTREGELVGMLILGRKLTGQLYSGEDERLLLTVAGRMAVELDNVRLFESVNRMRRELEEENERKTEFLHSVAHELKTPLTAVLSSSELLANPNERMDPDVTQRLSDNIHQGAEAMNRRVNELLDLARLQKGEIVLKPERLPVATVVESVVERLRVIFNTKQQTLQTSLPADLPDTWADRDRVEQVLANLLSNANKFSPSGGSVTIRARANKGHVIMEIEDSAPEITEEEKTKIFTPYYRGEDATRRHLLPGLGLGLSISRKLMELQHGEIWLETKPGRGNVFAFSLPVARD